MRCALSFDENKDLIYQKVAAWGEMQPLSEEPCYREEDIGGERQQAFFTGYKAAMSAVYNDIKLLAEDGEITENASLSLQRLMAGRIAMLLFSILDIQEE